MNPILDTILVVALSCVALVVILSLWIAIIAWCDNDRCKKEIDPFKELFEMTGDEDDNVR